jgi:hypothetical protein
MSSPRRSFPREGAGRPERRDRGRRRIRRTGTRQALNMRDNGIRCIVGEGDFNWQKAIDEGFVPARPSFRPWRRARGHGRPVPAVRRGPERDVAAAATAPDEGGRPSTSPTAFHCLSRADRGHSPGGHRCHPRRPQRRGQDRPDNFLAGTASIPAMPSSRMRPGRPSTGPWPSAWPSVRDTCSPRPSRRRSTATSRGARGAHGLPRRYP